MTGHSMRLPARPFILLAFALAAGIVCSACDRSNAAVSSTSHPRAPARVAPTGRSDIEQRYVYAPPDEGAFTVPLTLDMALPGQVSIEEPAMVAGGATIRVAYSKARNTVTIDLEARGLPFRPSFAKNVDDSTAWNTQPMSVKNVRWQLWLAGTMFGRQHEDLFYGEGTPREFLGTRYDFPPLGEVAAPLPGTYELAQGNARQMIGLTPFEGSDDDDVAQRFVLAYDRLVDVWGTPGSLSLMLPLDGCKPDAMASYWTGTRLPTDKVMTWDTFLASIWSGEGIGFWITAEPESPPAELAYRESGFVGWANVYPAAVPRGFGFDYCSMGTLLPIHERTYQLALWPPTSRRNLCRYRKS
jgi:hypothetical protein